MTERERRPRSREWRELPVPSAVYGARSGAHAASRVHAASRWRRGPVIVISTLVDAELPGEGGGVGPTWHASITRLGKRPRPRDVERFLRDFDLVGAEEDNHHPGAARNFFLPVDPALRGQCECKTTEDVITEADGYQWTNPKSTALEPCRGCELETMRGKPCPVHTVRVDDLPLPNRGGA